MPEPAFTPASVRRAKTYEYRIVNAPFVSPFLFNHAWHVPQPLDFDAMREAAAPLAGRHDFAAYQGAGAIVHSSERTIERFDWERGGGPDRPLVMRVTGDGFLRHMVRNIDGHAGGSRGGPLGSRAPARDPRVTVPHPRRSDRAAARACF